jgi:hypothetical protein
MLGIFESPGQLVCKHVENKMPDDIDDKYEAIVCQINIGHLQLSDKTEVNYGEHGMVSSNNRVAIIK